MRRLRPHNRARGYTLPEILIASALLGIILLGAARWVTGLVGVSATHADLSQPRITARFVAETFRSDLASAEVCHPAGVGGVLHAIGDDELALYRDDDGDGDVDLVWWRHDVGAGLLERVVVDGTGSCNFPADPPASGWATLASNVTPSSDGPAFRGLGGPVDGYVGDCTRLDAELCLFDAVRLRVVPVSPATGFPAPVDRTVEIDLTESRL